MIPDIQAVDRIIRETARQEILPRFRKLTSADISHKAPGDLVTTADVAAEKRLTEALQGLLPGSAVVGEEAADSDPGLLSALADDAPVWLVDPVDGTQNFAKGKPCFAVIIGVCRGGETLAGWIHDPLAGVTAWAAAGQGAWLDDHPIRLPRPPAMGAMTATLTKPLAGRLAARKEAGTGDAPARRVRYYCTGREYMDLARGKLHMGQYTRLKPWDHAAGVLIHLEAGGFSGLAPDCAPYRPAPHVVQRTLLLAPDRATWDTLHEAFADR